MGTTGMKVSQSCCLRDRTLFKVTYIHYMHSTYLVVGILSHTTGTSSDCTDPSHHIQCHSGNRHSLGGSLPIAAWYRLSHSIFDLRRRWYPNCPWSVFSAFCLTRWTCSSFCWDQCFLPLTPGHQKLHRLIPLAHSICSWFNLQI
jgi:hypothetical protein